MGRQTSKHQNFIYGLTMSGKSLPEIQQSWHEYYLGLSDVEKNQVWEEFYTSHAQASKLASVAPEFGPQKSGPQLLPKEQAIIDRSIAKESFVSKTVADAKDIINEAVGSRGKLSGSQHLKSLLFGLGVGAIAILILMFGLFNERVIAPFIQPSRNVTNTPIISEDSVAGNDPEIIIPKINVEIPVVYGVTSVSDNEVNEALESGVLHYGGTPEPGQSGNAVIVGHSSNNIFNQGKYKFAFVLLSRLDEGDTFYLEKDGTRYTYQVYEKKIVKPTDISVLSKKSKPATVTLITCDPPGTTTNRLVIVGEQISPDPSKNKKAPVSDAVVEQAVLIPGSAPSLWSRITGWFF
jgi:sortase A